MKVKLKCAAYSRCTRKLANAKKRHDYKGEAALRKELDHLIKVVRPGIIEAIATAREHGDLKENAEYHAAREQQSFAEGRVQDIEGKLSNSQIIDISAMPQGDRVIFGALVTIINIDTDETVSYRTCGR